MNNNYKPMKQVIPQLIEHLKQSGYSPGTIEKYQTTFRSINRFMNTNNDFIFDADTCKRYIAWLLNERDYSEVARTCQNKIRCANALLEFQLTGSILFRSQLKRITSMEGPLYEKVSDYILCKEAHGYKESTIYCHRTYLLKFCHYLAGHGITKFTQMSQEDILGYLENLAFCKTGTVSSALAPLRGFLHFLYEIKYLETDYSYIVPKDSAPRQAKLPSHYTEEEIKNILNAIDRGNPKGRRNYALVLLIAETGLRSSDVCALQFKDILWDRDLICLKQYKTGNTVSIPLLPETGNAIIDYLKNDRPKSELRNIFLRLAPPYLPLTTSQVRNIVTEYIQKAGLDRTDPHRRKGPHALRHSLAGRLLEKQTPLPVISSILGHTSSTSTTFYLGIDRTSLEQCALDVPECYSYVEGGDLDA